jgi:hypothetical protein
MVALSSAPVSNIAHGVGESPELPLSNYVLEMPNGSQERCQSSDDSKEIQRVPASPIVQGAREQTNGNLDISTSSAKLRNTQTDPQSRTFAQSSGPHNVSQLLLSSARLPTTLGYLSNRGNTRANSFSTPTSSAVPAFTANSK